MLGLSPTRRQQELQQEGGSVSAPRPGFIHTTAVIGSPPEHRDWTKDAWDWLPEIDKTAQLNAFCTVDSGTEKATRIGARTFAMSHCHIGHDSQIGDDVELAAGAITRRLRARSKNGQLAQEFRPASSRDVTIGDGARLGVRVCVKPRVTIGAGARIGAGAVVVHDVPPGETWVGNPARNIKDRSDHADLWGCAYGDQSHRPSNASRRSSISEAA